jgi:hypothetical protein
MQEIQNDWQGIACGGLLRESREKTERTRAESQNPHLPVVGRGGPGRQRKQGCMAVRPG